MADVDMTDYPGAPIAWNPDLTAESLLIPAPGKLITATDNGPGKAPVGRSLKKLKDIMITMHDGLFGTRTGATRRTLKSLEVDGNGGAVSTLLPGLVKAVAYRAVQYLEINTGSSVQTISGVTGVIERSAGGKFTYTYGELFWEGTAAGGSNPASTAAAPNTLDALTIPKGWAKIVTDGAGNITVADGARIASATIAAGNKIQVTLATAMDNADYSVVGHNRVGGAPSLFNLDPADQLAGSFKLTYGVNPATTAIVVWLQISGRQTT